MSQTMNVCFSQASDGGLDEEKNRKNIQDHRSLYNCCYCVFRMRNRSEPEGAGWEKSEDRDQCV